MSSEMAERIARAIWDIRREDDDRCDMELEDMGRSHSVWREALAVLKAMREPTFGMREAATRRRQGPDDCLYGSVFTSMIDHEIKLAEGGRDGEGL